MLGRSLRTFLTIISIFGLIASTIAIIKLFRDETILPPPSNLYPFIIISVFIIAPPLILVISSIRSIIRKMAKDFTELGSYTSGSHRITKYNVRILHGEEAVTLSIKRLVLSLIPLLIGIFAIVLSIFISKDSSLFILS